MKDLMLLISVLLPVDPGAGSSPLIRKIEVQGNLRVPAGSILHTMNSRPRAPLERIMIADDIRRLHRTRLFRDVEIRALPAATGEMDVIVHVREQPFVSRFSIEGIDEGLNARIHELLRNQGIEFRPATPYDPASGARAARAVRSWLATRAYPLAEVRAECEDKGTVAIVRLRIRLGPRLGVGKITFAGNHSIPAGELKSLLRETRTSFWQAGWRKVGYYAPERSDADCDRIRRHYRSRGFAGVTIGRPDITVQRSRSPVFSMRSVTGRRLALDISIPIAEGTGLKGYRFVAGTSASYRSLMRSAESVGGSVRLTRYLADPCTGGRNSFSLDLNLAALRPAAAGGIAPEKRLYPGGDILRGFRRGGLGSWAVGQDGLAGASSPVGADTMASVSAEYRVPIAGRLSGVAFFDLGWTRLDPAAISEPGLRLVRATNALLRASTGGELRLELPVIDKPARLILAWNPLRLDRILRDGASIEKIADPPGLVRFALGTNR